MHIGREIGDPGWVTFQVLRGRVEGREEGMEVMWLVQQRRRGGGGDGASEGGRERARRGERERLMWKEI